MEQKVKKEHTYFILFALTAFFFLLEISFFIQCNKAYLDDFNYVTNKIAIPLSILPGILYFFFAQLFIHLAYIFAVGFVSNSVLHFFKITKENNVKIVIGLWFLGLTTVLSANQYFFPYSKFSELTSLLLITPAIAKYIFYVSFSIFIFFIFLSVVNFIYFFCINHKMIACISSATLFFSSIYFFFFYSHQLFLHGATRENPNVILIGVDSLRPDFLSYFGSDNQTPSIDSFLNESSVFSEAVTPLARTFPSWIGILTGNYPKNTGVRSNLAPQKNLDLTQTLPQIFKTKNYRTIYATDEVRFSNIDKQFGFDTVIEPPIGLNDFLLGEFNDFPFSNLIVNTMLGKWLFPHSYANRAVAVTYNPNTFLKSIVESLQEKNNKPVFLAVHFCLPHLPYLWSNTDIQLVTSTERYAASVNRVDQQVGDFLRLLERNGYLDHAIVVLLSDHGEAIELPGDRITEADLFLLRNKKNIPRFYPPNLDNEKINESIGHGTDVLGLPQYHSLLAFKLYGLSKQQKKNFPDVVSLLDIKPTILQLLKWPISKTDGIRLDKLILGKQEKLPSHHVYLESDFSPEAIRTVYPETREVMLEGVQIFQIDPITTRLTVKNSMEQMIIHSKQVADIYGDWMLALYPQTNNARMPILINLTSGHWTNNLNSFFARQSPAKDMLAALQNFYNQELPRI